MSSSQATHPESLMMSYGFKPELSEGSLKCPIFATSTFVFKSAADGKRFFEVAYGKREAAAGEELGLIYSRLNNPDLEILENRLSVWDGAESAAVFESGMAAISTVMLTYLRPGTTLIHSEPLYGGTHHFIRKVLPEFGVKTVGFTHEDTLETILNRIPGNEDVRMVYIETPANPTNHLIDLQMVSELGKRLSTADHKVITACDNTYLGPMWQRPLEHGLDLAIYSATKYIGGHSDVIAGSVVGSEMLLKEIKGMRTFLGNMAGPWTGWMLLRSLETLKVRTDRQAENARVVAEFLKGHPVVTKVNYLGFLEPGSRGHAIYARQCDSPGAMISFEVRGGETEAFQFLDALKLVRLAVSLGGTESLAEHPASMTHCDMEPEERALYGVPDTLIRLSVGVEHPDDLVADLCQALDAID